MDVAPDRFVTEALFDQLEIDYTSVDLARPNATHRMDVTALEFDDDSFDWIVCYHVLEHVEDDRKAMSELCRVLKPGGRAILQVPIWSDATFEDEGAGRADYLRLYGHHDHVRRYGLDYKDRLESAGFDVTLDGYVRTLSKETARRYGLLENEDIYVCGKARVRTGNSTELAVTPSTPVSTE